jgi:exonuclease V
MKTGSKIHQKLEDEVHTTVPVHIMSKEDGFALRIWNAISGLRCLRETGLTRELEVWGLVEGEVVNGVIDELSYQPPDATAKTHPYYTNKEGLVFDDCEAGLQVYLTDVKTRSADSLPGVVALRPTCMQLMLYRHLIEKLASNTVDAEVIFARYQLQPLEPLTEQFLEDISDIGAQEASAYPNLLSLWSLLVTELQLTLPPNILSPILRAEFRSARSGNVIGSQLFMHEEEEVEKWIADQFAWWNGHRPPKGVDIEEAYKCKSCDFAEGCGWRKSKIEEAVTKSRLRADRRVKSIV